MEEVVEACERALLAAHQVENTVSGFTEQSQLLLFDRLNRLVAELASLHALRDKCQSALVPPEILSLVDEGRNPALYTQGMFNDCLTKNQATKGKVEAFQQLYDSLMLEAQAAYPEESTAYESIRATPVPLPSATGNGHNDIVVKSEAAHDEDEQKPMDLNADVMDMDHSGNGTSAQPGADALRDFMPR